MNLFMILGAAIFGFGVFQKVTEKKSVAGNKENKETVVETSPSPLAMPLPKKDIGDGSTT